MKAKDVHPLAKEDSIFGKVSFTRDGKNHVFKYCVNKLNGDLLYWFDNEPPRTGVHEELKMSTVKNIIKNLKEDEKISIISLDGSIQL